MKIEFTPKRVKLTRVAIALVAISLAGYVAYAATQLTISNSGTVSLGSQNIQGITFSPPLTQPTCSSQTTYTDTPAPIAWGNVAQGTSATGYVCVKNIGGAGHSFTSSTTTLPATGITVTYNGTATLTSSALASGGTSLINVVVNVANTVPATTSISFTTTIA